MAIEAGNDMDRHRRYMNRCIELAKDGLGRVAPNPVVGAVIVHNDTIIGEGFHRLYGGPHAEVNAVMSVKDKSLLKESTLYVNLEPCSHHGKTPPCTELICKYEIPEVVVGSCDSNPIINGRGVRILEEKGIKVITGVLEKECRELNRRFFTFHEKKRPYIILKWAKTIDGFIDIDRTLKVPGQNNWITSEPLRVLVHKWRSEEAAILVGTNTARNDNPKLNVRNWSGYDPLRMVIDKRLTLPRNLNLFDGSIPTLVFTAEKKCPQIKNVEYCTIKFNENVLHQILDVLHERGIQSLFIEGGRKLLNNFIEKELWDEARVLTGDKEFEKGLKAPMIEGKCIYSENIGSDKLDVIRPLTNYE